MSRIAAVDMDARAESSLRPATDDVELEDGEICDDDSEEAPSSAAVVAEATARRKECCRGDRPDGGGGGSSTPRPPRPPYAVHQPPDFSHTAAYDARGPVNRRQQCGPERAHAHGPPSSLSSSLPSPSPGHGLLLLRPPAPPPPLAPLAPAPVQPRGPSFWERSHGALWRFRHRSVPNGGRGGWNRGGWVGARPPVPRYGFGEFGNKRGGLEDCPSANQRSLGKNPARRAAPSPDKRAAAAESFEDLLAKYKEIQRELESIRKEESKALEARAPAPAPAPTPVQRAALPPPDTAATPAPAPPEKRQTFQAFNIKPLRIQLPTPAGLDGEEGRESGRGSAPESPWEDDGKTPGGESSASSDDVFICLDELEGQVEEEDLSELQLRLLALQSASRTWQQKERHLMKKSREPADTGAAARERLRPRIQPRPAPPEAGRPEQKRPPPPSPRARKVGRRRDRDERRKREEEIRKIRDLSNQDEQYKRFMKLVGAKPRVKAREGEARKSAGSDAAGNLYQYDNYEQVAMDTDSEPGSPSVPAAASAPDGTPRTRGPASAVGGPAVPRRPSADARSPLLPPDGAAPPAEPPFAEEEEEMLLRETCLMSMASKRAEVTSRPPSPNAETPAVGEQRTRVNADAEPRALKFARGASRAPLVLPRHKSVVVSLDESDDSDSDSAPMGGLEFMIKEARRTAEVNAVHAVKAKGTSEKENHPLRTPEALPEAKKAEYRFLREELASRERQKAPAAAAAAAVVAAAVAAASLVSQAEQKLRKQRELLARDRALLENLLQQQLKKSESLKAAESKVARLREQVLASEKIALANKTLLKKIQEQVRRVEQRVSIKTTLAARLEQELLWTRTVAGRAPKRKAGAVLKPAKKFQRSANAATERLAALMAQKRRLQQMESEYAFKIQKLKEAQALRHRTVSGPAALPPPQVCPPQPSLHDLTQDVLVLDSEDAPEADHPSAVSARAATGPRRRSAGTRPNLEQPVVVAAAGEGGPAEALPAEARPPSPSGPGSEVPKSRRLGLGELLREELAVLGELRPPFPDPEPPSRESQAPGTEAESGKVWALGSKPVPLGPYRSPLLVFKSYRFSPYYRTKEKLSLSSPTYSNAIRPRRRFCRFDLSGTCNDDDCSWQHTRKCGLTGSHLLQDVLSYNLALIGCSDGNSDARVGAATEKYLSKLLGPHKDEMAADQKAVFLVSKVNESCRHVPPFTTWKGKRRWRPWPESRCDTEHHHAEADTGEWTRAASEATTPNGSEGPEDKRYFAGDADDIGQMESGVLDDPADAQLWIKLAYRYLRRDDASPAECLEAALNALSRALENNCAHPEVWTHYLTLFSRRGHADEVREMCQMAVEHAAHVRVWWTYLTLASTFEVKDSVCVRLMDFLLARWEGQPSERSFRLLEALLYRVHLNVFTGRADAAVAIFRDALTGERPAGVAERLGPELCALAWCAYIHLREFGHLPAPLVHPTESGPSRLPAAQRFLFPWRSPADVITPAGELMALFQDGVRRCQEPVPTTGPGPQTWPCLPLHLNWLLLRELSDGPEEAASQCEALLEACPESSELREFLCRLHVRSGKAERAAAAWADAQARRPADAEVLYRRCRFLMAQGRRRAPAPLFRSFVSAVCEETDVPAAPLDFLRSALGLPVDRLRSPPVVRKHLEGELLRQRPFLHLLHCRWHWMHESTEGALDAFERALGAAGPRRHLRRLWTDYLEFCATHAVRRLPELVLRCLGTVPTRLEAPYEPSRFWTSYGFHNEVLALYLAGVERTRHADLLQRLHYVMPNNVALAVRLMHEDFLAGNLEHVRFQARMLTNSAPKCLPAWNIAVAVEMELQRPAEARRVLQQALRNLPLCAHLWKQLLQLEARGDADGVARVASRAREAGVAVPQPAVAAAAADPCVTSGV
ncbi:zinc finger C3H1 domain-containing protein isoform X2 [Stigmatopora nigra]